jgi:RNA polymerase sigma-70 factor (sigma-E family)
LEAGRWIVPNADLVQSEVFVAHRLPALYRYARTLTGSRHDAEDLVQEALTRTGVAWRRVLRKDDPEGYVRMTMVRIIANRRRRPYREYPVSEGPDRPLVDGDLERVTDDAAFHTALAGLPLRMRAVLVLRYVDQLTDMEIADLIGCSVGTVRSQAARAISKLRARVDAWEVGRG